LGSFTVKLQPSTSTPNNPLSRPPPDITTPINKTLDEETDTVAENDDLVPATQEGDTAQERGMTDCQQVGTSAISFSAVMKYPEATSSYTSQYARDPVNDAMPRVSFVHVPHPVSTLRLHPPRSTTLVGLLNAPLSVFELPGPWDLDSSGKSTSSSTSATPADQAIQAEKEVEKEEEKKAVNEEEKEAGKEAAKEAE
jgi:hypothetical protein